MGKHAMSNFFKVWKIYRTGVSKWSGANVTKRSNKLVRVKRRMISVEYTLFPIF